MAKDSRRFRGASPETSRRSKPPQGGSAYAQKVVQRKSVPKPASTFPISTKAAPVNVTAKVNHPTDSGRSEGVIKAIVPKGRYGFMVPDDGGGDIFFSFSQAKKGTYFTVGQRVSYRTAPGTKGGLKAIEILLL